MAMGAIFVSPLAMLAITLVIFSYCCIVGIVVVVRMVVLCMHTICNSAVLLQPTVVCLLLKCHQ